MEKAGLIGQLRNETSGIRDLGKVDKVYLDNTNITFNLVGAQSNLGNIRETFTARVLCKTGYPADEVKEFNHIYLPVTPLSITASNSSGKLVSHKSTRIYLPPLDYD